MREVTGAPFLAVDDPLQAFVGTMLLEGLAPTENPTTWPLSVGRLSKWTADADSESDWLNGTAQRIHDRLQTELNRPNRLHNELRVGARIATQDRRDLLRFQDTDELSWQPMLLNRTWIQSGAWTASLGIRIDRYYEVDPDGMDTAHRWLSRAEDAFIAREGRNVGFFFGRMTRHWGEPGQAAFLLSANPRPMDHLAFRVGPRRLNVQTVLAELDSFTGDGRMTGTAGADSVASGSTRRMLATHRLTFEATERWTVGLAHATLYSGPGAGFSLKFANPFNVALYEIDNRPKNDENNGLIGAFFAYRDAQTRARGELLLDDVDVLNGNEPASIAATLSAERRGISRGVNLGISGTVVTARTFNSEQAEGRYVYLGRGIGTQQSDFAHFRAHADWLRFPGWIVRAGVDVLREGEADFREDLPGLDEKTLFTGTPETVIRPFLTIHGMMANGVDVALHGGWNQISDAAHVDGATDSALTASLSISYRIVGSRGL